MQKFTCSRRHREASMIGKNIADYAELLKDYTELRLQENRTTRIGLLNGSLTTNETSATGGVSARVCRNGSWGFSSSPGQAAESVKTVIKAALENAAFLDSRLKKGKGPLPSAKGVSENDFSTKKPRRTQKELVEFAKEIDS